MGVYFSHLGVSRAVTHSSLEPPVGNGGGELMVKEAVNLSLRLGR